MENFDMVVTVVFSLKDQPIMEFFPGCIDHNSRDRCHSLTDLFLEMVHVNYRSLVKPFFDITPQEKVQRCDIWKLGRPGCRSSTSNPAVGKGGIQTCLY